MRQTLSPSEASLRGRIGAYTLHATHDPRETTRAARAAFNQRFESEVDPDGTLPPEERERRAKAARKAYYAKLALKSVMKRRHRKEESVGGSNTTHT